MKIFRLLFCLCPLFSAFGAEAPLVPTPAKAPAAGADPATTATQMSHAEPVVEKPLPHTPPPRPVFQKTFRTEPSSVLAGSGSNTANSPGIRHTWLGPGPSGYAPWYWWKIPPPWTPSFATAPWYWQRIPQPTPGGELSPAKAVASPLRPDKQDVPASVRLRNSRLPGSRPLPAPEETPARLRMKQYQMPTSPSRPASVPRFRSAPRGLPRR